MHLFTICNYNMIKLLDRISTSLLAKSLQLHALCHHLACDQLADERKRAELHRHLIGSDHQFLKGKRTALQCFGYRTGR